MARRSKRRAKRNRLPSLYNGRAVALLLLGLLFGLALYTYDSLAYLTAHSAKLEEQGIRFENIELLTKDKTGNGNLIGSGGNIVAFHVFSFMGLGGFLIPVALMGVAIGQIVPGWDHMKRHWWTIIILILVICGMSSMHDPLLLEIKPNPWNNSTAGGFLGDLVVSVFGFFGKFGGTVMLILLYMGCIYWFTDRQLFVWANEWWDEKKEEEFEAYTSSLKKKAKSVLKGYRTESAISESESDQGNSNKKTSEPGNDPFLEKARTSKSKKNRQPVTSVAEESQTESSDSEVADWGEFPEPTIRDMSQPSTSTQSEPHDQENAVEDLEQETEAQPSTDDEGAEFSKKPATASEILSLSKGNEPPPAEDAENASQEEQTLEPDATAEPPKPLYQPKTKSKGPVRVASVPTIRGYKLPGITHLGLAEPSIQNIDIRDELMNNALLMQTTLSQFKIEVKLGDITKGPTITRYELHPAPGIKMEKITSLTNNIAAALQAERINILAPIPGKSSVGIEVPNRVKSMVMMRELLESPQWKRTKAKIPVALGKDVYGKPIIADLADMPHLLIAGATGSGKSVCINSVIASLLYRFKPDEMRFVMIDPKVVELQQYNHLPHLVVPVVNDPKKVILALRWVINEMEKRYQIFAKVGVRNINNFNSRQAKKEGTSNQPELPLDSDSGDGFAVELDKEISVPRDEEIEIPDKLSYIVVIIDELADLMLVAPADVEMAIARITQMARAAGIHCIVATQRPSVDVITGVIKANIPCRIAFQVAAKVDSRTILDAMGADKLLGKGDMLYLPPGSAKLIRAQGALITDEEIQSIVESINDQGKPTYEVEIHEQLSKKSVSTESKGGIDEDEELIEKCIDVIRSEKKASVSLMQRRLRLGYTRAARIMDELEDRGIVGPNRGAEPREILVDLDGTGADGQPVH